ncbi:MAG: response regulator [Alphaproteobacteria bacterium]|nr:response regulator [Alphaproteobacteria bacterium]
MAQSDLLEDHTFKGTATRPADRPHVVVVDDDPTMRDILSRYLTHCGFDVSTCETSDDILSVLQCSVVDMLITDLSMPEDGTDIIRKVRSISADLPIIVVTGRPLTEADQDFIETHVTEVFEKPTRLNELAKTASTIAMAQGCIPRP